MAKVSEGCGKVVGKVTYASWRNKWRGWHDSWAIGIDGEKHGKKVNWHDSYNSLIKERKTFVNSRLSQGDKFYALFLGDGCLGGLVMIIVNINTNILPLIFVSVTLGVHVIKKMRME